MVAAVSRAAAAVRLRALALLVAVLSIGTCDTIPIGEKPMVGTWEVESVNGIATGGGERFQMTFTRNDKFYGRLGCNQISGRFHRAASTTFDQVVVTRMACADMRFETWGLGMMNQPVVVSQINPRMTWTNPPNQMVFRKLN